MPTGYTAHLEDGKITTMKEYVLRCATAFGGERFTDYKTGLPFFEPTPSQYCKRSYEESEEKYTALRRMTDAEFVAKLERETEELKSRAVCAKADEQEKRERYINMLKLLSEWHPPKQYERLRDFAVEQINISAKSLFDERFYDEQIREAQQRLERVKESEEEAENEKAKDEYEIYNEMMRCRKRWDEEVGAVENWKRYIAELVASLSEAEATENARNGCMKSAWDIMREDNE